ncbi:MAG: hypothetical protein ACR2MT_04470 [Aurantibacter sp.]
MVLKLLSKTFLFVAIIITLSYTLLYLNSNYDVEYIGGIRSKMKKLKEVKGRKIVIVGGSNASFGIDTDVMEDQLKMPVVNMALHGGLPAKYMIEQVRPHLQNGDILIMSREHDGLAGDYRWNHMVGTEVPLMPTYDFSEIRVLLSDRNLFETSITSFFNTIKLYVRWHPFERRKEVRSVYDSRVFKEDNILPKYMNGTYKDSLTVHRLKRPNPKSLLMNGLKAYKGELEEKGVACYITPAVVVEGYYSETEILPFWEYISEHTGIPLLNNKKTYVYKKTYFLNSQHHTNLEGRALRTRSLIQDIVEKKLVNSDMDNFR